MDEIDLCTLHILTTDAKSAEEFLEAVGFFLDQDCLKDKKLYLGETLINPEELDAEVFNSEEMLSLRAKYKDILVTIDFDEEGYSANLAVWSDNKSEELATELMKELGIEEENE